MPEPTRQHMFSEAHIRTAAMAVTLVMIITLVALLLLISARPQGRFGEVDTSQFERTLSTASEDLTGFRELEDGRVQLDIDRAIELVAERGVADPFTALAQEEDGAAAQEAEGEAPADAEARVEAAEDVPEGPEELPDGAQVYASCAGCHQANGQGVPGAFPPLAGHAADLYQAEPAYLADVVLFGLQGQIEVEGANYNGLMPAWANLSDAQIAAVLNYILDSWGNEEQLAEDQPYSSGFIEERRALDLSMQEVLEHRQELDLQ